jgi:tetratricopeptide (TPR) repeat protein
MSGEYILYILISVLGMEFAALLPVYYGALLLKRGQYRRAMPFCKWSYTLSKIIPTWKPASAFNLCACHFSAGDYDTALHLAELSAREAQRFRSSHIEALAQSVQAILITRTGDSGRAVALMEAALETSLPSHFRPFIALNAGAGYLSLGNADKAEMLLREAATDRRTHPEIAPLADCNLMFCLYYQGRLEEALILALETAKPKRYAGDLRTQILISLQSGQIIILAVAGKIAEAQEIERQMLRNLPLDEPHLLSAPYRAIAELALQNGDLDRARHYAEMAYPLDPRPMAQAQSLLIQAEVFAARKNARRAADLCAEALRHADTTYVQQRSARLTGATPSATSLSPAETTEEQTISILRWD